MTEDATFFARVGPSLRLLGQTQLPRGRVLGSDSLRRPQIAAAMAVAAHFSTSAQPAIVTMPTGTGKSGVMSLIPFVLAASRVLVVTPSKLLREQLASEIAQLRVLRRTDVVPGDVGAPRTIEVKSQLRTREAWDELRVYDVVVGTPNSLSPHQDEVVDPPPDLFDLVVIDEAHHTSAPSYKAIIDAFPQSLTTLFTATPFRRDRQQIPGENVYTFSLAQALEERILAPIEFIPIDPPLGLEPPEIDLMLARAAAARMNSAHHIRADSRIIARTSTVQHARDLLNVYRAASLQMGLITNTSGQREVRETLQQLRDGDLAGLVSVGVLGEGFDFPELKIGVYHRRHASLAPTLQFLGRIARVLPTEVTAELIATREEVSDETRDLYASDVAWSALVPEIADAATAAEAERRSYVRSFQPTPQEPLSTSALRPRKDVKIYQYEEDAPPFDLERRVQALSGGRMIYQGLDADRSLGVFITEHLERPEWIAADALDSWRYELHVIFHDRARRLLFVHGTRDGSISELLRALGLGEQLQLVDPLWIDRLQTSLAVAGYHSVGMRSARAAGGRLAAYRMMAGTSVGPAVTAAESRSYGTGHTIARVYDPMTTTSQDFSSGAPVRSSITSLGVSYARGKVFSPDLALLLDFRRWCIRLADLVEAQSDSTPTGPPDLALYSPRRIVAFPSAPYAALLDPTLAGSGLTVVDPTTGEVASLEELEFNVARVSDEILELSCVTPSGPPWQATMDTSGLTTAVSGTWEVLAGHDRVTLAAFLTENPLSVFYADGRSSIGGVIFQPLATYPPIDPAAVTNWSFDGADITAEHTGAGQGLQTVKEWVLDQIDVGFQFIIDDDRAGEMADLVLVRFDDRRVTVRLLHLKASREPAPGARVEDFYDLLGQACRSTVWCEPGRWRTRLLSRLDGASYLHRGQDLAFRERMDQLVREPLPIAWEIGVVQPGFSGARVDEVANINTMLNDFIMWTTQHDATPRMYFHD